MLWGSGAIQATVARLALVRPETVGRWIKVRVLYYIAYPHRMAGANRSLAELVTHLPNGLEPIVVLAADGPVAAFYREAGVDCLVLRPDGVWGEYGLQGSRGLGVAQMCRAAAPFLKYSARFIRLLRERAVDIVHVNDFRGALLVGPATRASRRPLVSHLRGEFPFGPLPSRVFTMLSSHVVAVSEGARSTLGSGNAGASVIYNGIGALRGDHCPIPWLVNLREQGVVVVTCFASVVPFKGIHHLVRAVAELNRRGCGARAVFLCIGDFVAGYERYHRWLKDLVQELGIENLTFAGWQANPFRFYASSDLSVLASVSHETLRVRGKEVEVRGSEGFPRTHLEAMQFGLPIVGTRIAGVPEQVEHGVNGLLVPPSEPNELADALEKLILLPALRRELGAAGRKRVERLFSTEAYVRGISNVYQRVMG